MPSDTVQALIESDRGVVTAAAGCGKTEAIALAVKALGAKGRQLVLTHTHAGVGALKARMKKLGVPPTHYRIDTLAGWSLRYASHYPRLSGVPMAHQPEGNAWNQVYEGAAGLIKVPALRRVVEASYAGVFVDEYQDCTLRHHALVKALAEIIPCRVLGDPLQGIFEFGGDSLVEWQRDVTTFFPTLPKLEQGRRWEETNPRLGAWLTEVRTALELGQQIDLRRAPVRWRQLSDDAKEQTFAQRAECWNAVERDGTVVALRQWAGACYDIAQNLKGTFGCMEEIECGDLLSAAALIQTSARFERASAVMEFGCRCMAGVALPLTPFRDAAKKGKLPTPHQQQKCRSVTAGIEEIVNKASGASGVRKLMDAIHAIPDRNVHRRELWGAMRRAVELQMSGSPGTLREIAWNVRNHTRHRGRFIEDRTISRTVLVKGLEFDHCIVLDAEEWDRKNFYVAVTRPRHSLVLCSKSASVCPPEKKKAPKGARLRSASHSQDLLPGF